MAVREAGRKLDPRDLPPRLHWEEPAWKLYEQISRHWLRTGKQGQRYALDMSLAVTLMREMGWQVSRGVELLTAIEDAILAGDREE